LLAMYALPRISTTNVSRHSRIPSISTILREKQPSSSSFRGTNGQHVRTADTTFRLSPNLAPLPIRALPRISISICAGYFDNELRGIRRLSAWLVLAFRRLSGAFCVRMRDTSCLWSHWLVLPSIDVRVGTSISVEFWNRRTRSTCTGLLVGEPGSASCEELISSSLHLVVVSD
jgi:hypothetical protein